jgi:hypothetical protein
MSALLFGLPINFRVAFPPLVLMSVAFSRATTNSAFAAETFESLTDWSN